MTKKLTQLCKPKRNKLDYLQILIQIEFKI